MEREINNLTPIKSIEEFVDILDKGGRIYDYYAVIQEEFTIEGKNSLNWRQVWYLKNQLKNDVYYTERYNINMHYHIKLSFDKELSVAQYVGGGLWRCIGIEKKIETGAIYKILNQVS